MRKGDARMRLKDVTECCPAYTGPDRNGTVAFVPMESLRYDSIDPKEIEYSEAKGKYTFFADGDLLFAKVTPCFENGNIAVAKGLKGGIGFGSSEIFVLRPNDKLLNQYLFYVAQGSPFRDGACATMCGVGGLKRIDPLFTRTFEFDLPPLPEQRAIVAYLDEKAAAIDRKVALLEKKLAAFKRLKTSIINRAVTRGLDPNVKLKDSGVDWIGQVPEGWGVSRVGSHYSIQLGKMLSSTRTSHDETLEKYYCAANVHYEGISGDVKEMWFSQGDKSAYKIHVGDMLVVEGGAGAGGCAIVECLDCDTYIQNSILRLRGDNLSNNKYLCYWFQNLGQRGYIEYACNVATIPHFTKEKMRQVPMPVPSLEEQREISAYLDAECAKIDKAAAVAEKQIDAYRRLKRSLINEVVTGKRKVA